VSTLKKRGKRESETQRDSSQKRRDLQNTKHDDINAPKYEIMIDERNAVINTVTGTVTVWGTVSTGWTLDRWDELLHESS